MKTLKIVIFSTLMVLTGCAGANFEPAHNANETGIWDASVTTVNNVRVVANPDSWVGDLEVMEHVTPMKVTVTNNSNRHVAIHYDDFALVTPAGERYAALPPYEVQGSITRPVLAGYTPILDPEIEYDRFLVAPYYAGVYPELLVYNEPFAGDYGYWNTYETYWNRRVDLPTQTMLRRALPEGVLEPGGHVTGYLYFQKVDPDEPMVKFRADLIDARSGEAFGTASIPFEVES